MRKLKLFLCLLMAILFVGCADDKDTLKVGTIAGPETQIMEAAQQVAKQNGLNFKIIEFTDYLQPNAALNDGSIDVNVFQHQPFLAQQIKDRHYKLVAIGKTFVFPMAIYSSKIKSIKEVPNKAIIAIPNDPSNETRALALLAKAGLITLKTEKNGNYNLMDVASNPKKIIFKELDAGQLARSLPDLTAAVINTNYAIPAGLSPSRDAIYTEGSDSIYANLIVTRADKASDPRIQQLIEALHSSTVEEVAKKIFKDNAIKAW